MYPGKYKVFFDAGLVREGLARPFELYNLEEDPNEAADGVAQHPNRVESMKSSLEAWLISVVHSLNGTDYR